MFHRLKRDLPRALNRYRNVGLWAIARLYVRAIRLQLKGTIIGPIEGPSRDEFVIVTLTTIPSRFGSILPVLKSLIDQSVSADQIILAVPWHCSREDMPYSEDLLRSIPDEVTVLRCDDLGPATKVLPVLKKSPNAVLIVVDDDVIYPQNFIETLLASHRRRPEAVFGYRGVRLEEGLAFKDLWHLFATAVDNDEAVDILFGTWGYIFSANILGDEVHDFSNYADGVRWVDDVWISGHFAKRGVPRFVVPATQFPIATPSSNRKALTYSVNKTGNNDELAIEAFNPFWRTTIAAPTPDIEKRE